MITMAVSSISPSAVDDRLGEMLDLHFDPHHGSEYWLRRALELRIDVRRELRTTKDLSRLGPMAPADLLGQPLRHFVPRALHNQWDQLIVGQTGGTTGTGAWTAYLEQEFHDAFIAPFEVAANHVGFPQGGDWLYVGPSGPHIIGKVVRSLARLMSAADPFSVDFDPRWVKKLPADSMAFSRYLDHVVAQAMEIIQLQPVSVIFTTPAVLTRMAAAMSGAHREAIRGVHYGGMALSQSDMERFQTELFPNAVHLSGYGNTLFGCCLELSTAPGRTLDYFPLGSRLLFEVLDDAGHSLPLETTGQVCFTRLDRSMLILRMRERDEAQLISLPSDSPAEFIQEGVRDPHSPIALAPNQKPGLY